jgi:hypothetical protein
VELLGDIEDLLLPAAEPLVESAEGRPLAVRIRLTGSTALHGHLTTLGTLDKLADSLALRLRELGEVWLEKIKLDTHPPQKNLTAELDLPLKYLSQVADDLTSDQGLRSQLLESIEELLRKSRLELLAVDSPLVLDSGRDAELSRLLAAAQELVLSRLSMEAQ